MPEEESLATVSLDTESRVKGICQLMDGLIFDVKVEERLEPDVLQERLLSLFEAAVESLDAFLEMGYSFLAKYRERQIVSASEERRCRRIMEEKYDAVLLVLKREYAILGMTGVEE